MNFNLDSQTYGSVRFKRAIPPSYAKWLIPGSQSYSAKGMFGTILVQQVNVGMTRLFYTICNIRKDLALDFTISQPVRMMHIALKNENRFDIIPGADTVCLKQGQFNMIRASSLKGTFYMEGDNEYRMVSIYYPVEQLRGLIPFFPFLDSFTKVEDPVSPDLLFKNNHWISSPVIDIINHLLHCHYRGSLRHLFFDYKLKELLFLLLSQEQHATAVPNGLNNRIIEAINEARYIMEEGYEETVTLNKIAKQVGISEIKLKSGLKLLFGIKAE